MTAVVAASTKENAVVLKVSKPHIAIKGTMRKAGKGGNGTYQFPLEKVKSLVKVGFVKLIFPCRIESARRLK
jgi:hypothetical protein